VNLGFAATEFCSYGTSPIYESIGTNVPKHNGTNGNALLVAAVFVIDENVIETFTFMDKNYKNIANIKTLLSAL
jgi:hypothetical protein